MAERTTVDGKLTVRQDGARERVAYDLTMHIAGREEIDTAAPRRYWLELYKDCLHAVCDYELRDIKERPLKR